MSHITSQIGDLIAAWEFENLDKRIAAEFRSGDFRVGIDVSGAIEIWGGRHTFRAGSLHKAVSEFLSVWSVDPRNKPDLERLASTLEKQAKRIRFAAKLKK
jgi:hypothetical protein